LQDGSSAHLLRARTLVAHVPSEYEVILAIVKLDCIQQLKELHQTAMHIPNHHKPPRGKLMLLDYPVYDRWQRVSCKQ
jgi:hypothetical protein